MHSQKKKYVDVKEAMENGERVSDKGTVRNNEMIDWGKVTDKFECGQSGL